MDGCMPNWRDTPTFSFYRYEPSHSAAALFAVLFSLTTALHVLQLARTRTWYLIPFFVGGFCEIIGYVGRALNANEEPGCWTLGPYIMQNLLLLIAPAFMAASIYMILGRIILVTEAELYSPIRVKWLTRTFVFGDVLSLLLQSSGGGMQAAGESMQELGENIVIVGLFVQLCFFGAFVVVSAIFHRRLGRAPTFRVAESNDPPVRWRAYLATLYITSSLIWVRSAFRVAEYIDGNAGVLMRSEVYVYVFDGLLMFIVLGWLNWFHPSEIGILLRGGKPSKHGFELVMMKST